LTPEHNGQVKYGLLEAKVVVAHAGLFLVLKLLQIDSQLNTDKHIRCQLKILYLVLKPHLIEDVKVAIQKRLGSS